MMSQENDNKPVCLAIGGLDPSGGAGIIADVRAFVAFGCPPSATITSVTFQNSKTVDGAEHISAETVRRQIMAILDEHDIAAVKTGMLPSSEIVNAVAEIIADRNLPNLVIDPVLYSTSAYPLISKDALAAIWNDLLPLATLITPNVPEMEQITGISIDEFDDIIAAAAILKEKGARNILIKGGHLPAAINVDKTGRPVSKDILFTAGEMTVIERELIANASVRGTGCMLASAIAADLALGHDLLAAVTNAKDFVHESIHSSGGARPS
jgi:hydroxymethylpyrimidine kinase/phosphomethylpyrimidine kinase